MNLKTVFVEVVHVVAQGFVWLVPLVLVAHPDWGTMTVSAVLSLVVGLVKTAFLSNSN